MGDRYVQEARAGGATPPSERVGPRATRRRAAVNFRTNRVRGFFRCGARLFTRKPRGQFFPTYPFIFIQVAPFQDTASYYP